MNMATISTHVLDTSLGQPASGILVSLERKTRTGSWKSVGRAVTDGDGRIASFVRESNRTGAGSYRLVFDSAGYFATQNVRSIYLDIIVAFEVRDPSQHYHIPLLLSPHGYTTYRGS